MRTNRMDCDHAFCPFRHNTGTMRRWIADNNMGGDPVVILGESTRENGVIVIYMKSMGIRQIEGGGEVVYFHTIEYQWDP